MINYREIATEELSPLLFCDFIRRQQVKECWRKIDGHWTIVPIHFVDDWSQEDIQALIGYLKDTLETGGYLLGAFFENQLKGFVSVEADLFGKNNAYLDLSSLHISEDSRGRGIGKELFQKAKEWAKAQGAQKLYISAHSAVATQAFYQAVGCKEAKEYHQGHVEQEPFDCQLECLL